MNVLDLRGLTSGYWQDLLDTVGINETALLRVGDIARDLRLNDDVLRAVTDATRTSDRIAEFAVKSQLADALAAWSRGPETIGAIRLPLIDACERWSEQARELGVALTAWRTDYVMGLSALGALDLPGVRRLGWRPEDRLRSLAEGVPVGFESSVIAASRANRAVFGVATLADDFRRSLAADIDELDSLQNHVRRVLAQIQTPWIEGLAQPWLEADLGTLGTLASGHIGELYRDLADFVEAETPEEVDAAARRVWTSVRRASQADPRAARLSVLLSLASLVVAIIFGVRGCNSDQAVEAHSREMRDLVRLQTEIATDVVGRSFVTLLMVDVRQGPSEDSPMVDRLPPATVLGCLKLDRGWAKVSFYDPDRRTQRRGWIEFQFLGRPE